MAKKQACLTSLSLLLGSTRLTNFPTIPTVRTRLLQYARNNSVASCNKVLVSHERLTLLQFHLYGGVVIRPPSHSRHGVQRCLSILFPSPRGRPQVHDATLGPEEGRRTQKPDQRRKSGPAILKCRCEQTPIQDCQKPDVSGGGSVH